MGHLFPLSLGVDLGGTSTRVGLFDAGMKEIASRRMATRVSAGPQACVDDMTRAANELLAEAGCAVNDVQGLGIGSPGPVNLRDGILGLLPNLPGWENFPLRDALAAATGLPVILESDANAAALAEWTLGAGKHTRVESMAMLTLGTGVGSGLILNGRIWHGMFGMGGEVGHASVEPSGLLCGCGSRGCLEMYASANGLVRLARDIAASTLGTPDLRRLVEGDGGFTTQQVAQLAETRQDPGACFAFHRLGHYLGLGIANLINILDLPMIVIGGGVASAWPLFAPSMFETIREYSIVYRLVAPLQHAHHEPDRTYIRPAMLGPSAGLQGAALLPQLARRKPAEQAASADLEIA